MTMVYEWGSRRFGVDPQAVGETVTRLARQNGGVCPPSLLVDESRPPESPTHKLFTWDDVSAAESWRRQEARQVVKSLRVITEETRSKPSAFVHVTVHTEDGPREGYKPFYEVVANEEHRAQALAEALQYLNGFRRRYRHLNELQPVFDAIDAVEVEEMQVAS